MIYVKCSIVGKAVNFIIVNIPKTGMRMSQQDLLNDIKTVIESLVDTNKNLQGRYDFLICLHDANDLVDDPSKAHHYMFGQDYFANHSIDQWEFVPLVHFYKKGLNIKYRYINITESSIWNYRVLYEKKTKREFELNHFAIVLLSIAKNTEKKLYELCVTREYAEVNARMTSMAYLEEAIIGKSGHAQYVAPFVFHSEREIDDLIKKEFESESSKKMKGLLQTKDVIKSQKWRILLVDDKSEALMQNALGHDYTGNNDVWCNKSRVIKGLLSSYLETDIEGAPVGDFTLKGTYNILIEYVPDKKGALAALQKKEYDIVLLDYLLDNGSSHIEYGCDLLNDIADDESLRKSVKVGPCKKLFFMFISAYSSAIYERLLADGLNQSEDYWFISVGACPINTPKLFLYNLIKLMEKRLDDSGILKLSSNEIYTLVSKIYLPKGQDSKGDSVRKRANAFYQEVLSLQYHYRSILKDVEIPFGQRSRVFDTKGSVLMTDFIQKKINLGGLLEHLTQLVHLTAFGTIRQWTEMWEEYIYFKAQFEKQLDEVITNDFNILCQNIENYILELKSQQQ